MRFTSVLIVAMLAAAALALPSAASGSWLEDLVEAFCDWQPDACSGGDWWE